MTTLTPGGKSALDTFIKETLETKKIPGFTLGVSNLDDEIYFNGGGPNVVDDPASGEITPDSVFWICSQTKMITALAGLKLIEQGKLTFDTPVGDYLPEFRNPVIVDKTAGEKTTFRPANTVVTVKHLLNFSSGLFYGSANPAEPSPGLGEAYSSKDMHAAADPVAAFFNIIVRDLSGVPLKFEPGTDFVYGWSSDALGFVIEKVSGQTLEDFCKEHIFNPLGMKTTFYLTPELRHRLVNLAFRDKDGKILPWANQLNIIEQDSTKLRVHLGGVGMYSTMRDYLKLLRHLLQISAGKSVANPILKQETVHEIFVPALTDAGVKSLSEMVLTPAVQWGTASGLTTEDWPNRRKKGSAFWGGWAGTGHFIDPASGIAVVFGVQLTPPGDVEVYKVWSKLETLIYSGLSGGSLREKL